MLNTLDSLFKYAKSYVEVFDKLGGDDALFELQSCQNDEVYSYLCEILRKFYDCEEEQLQIAEGDTDQKNFDI